MEPRQSTLLSEILAILAKDIRSELRARVAVNSIFLFAVTTLFLVSYVIGPYKVASPDKPYILSAWLWIILFFCAMSGMSRVFIKEEEAKTSSALQLASRPAAVYIGKCLFNFLIMISVSVIITPLYIILMEFQIHRPFQFGLMVLCGLTGLAAGVTLIAAVVAKARMQGTLFPILSFPIIIPLLLVIIDGTSKAAVTAAGSSSMQSIAAVLSFTGAMFVISLLLFDRVWLD